jgi:hypothetical protein
MSTVTLVPRRRLVSPMWCSRLLWRMVMTPAASIFVADAVVRWDVVAGGEGFGPVVVGLDGGAASQGSIAPVATNHSPDHLRHLTREEWWIPGLYLDEDDYYTFTGGEMDAETFYEACADLGRTRPAPRRRFASKAWRNTCVWSKAATTTR